MKKVFSIREILTQAGIAGSYFLAGKLCLQLAYLHPSASPVWAPSGIALACMLIFGYRVWPAIAIGAFFVNYTTYGPLLSSFGIAAGNTLEAVMGVYFIEQFAQGRKAFDSSRNVLFYLLLAGFLCTMISATFGVGSLLLTSAAPLAEAKRIWLTWWLGDASGNIIVAPVIILWSNQWRIRWNRSQALEALLLSLTLLMLTLVVFSDLYISSYERYALKYLCIPPVIWTAYRFGNRAAATATLILSAFALGGSLNEYAVTPSASAIEFILLMQTYMGVIAITGLVFAAVVAEQRRGEEALKSSNTALEERVQERTLSLSRMIADLRLEILQRREMEKSLRDSQERFRLLVEAVKEYAIIMLDPEGKVVSWNAGAERLKGYSSHEVIGQHFSLFYTKEDAEKGTPDKLLKLAASRGKASHIGLRVRKDGTTFWADVLLSPLFDKEGRLRGYAKITRDVSERRKAEEALIESEERFKQLLGSNFIGFMILNDQGAIVEANDTLLKIVGYSREEIAQEALTQTTITPPQFHLLDQWMNDRLNASGMCPPMEKEYIRKDGCRIPVLIGMVQLRGTPMQRLCFVLDVTERRAAQDAMRKAYDELEVRVQQRTAELQEEVQRRQHAEEELRNLATRDALTGLYNRRGFMALAEKHFDLARRQQKALLLFMGDLDDLKQINDTFGHTEGDAALIKTAEILQKTFRQSDIVTRIGGDEFAMIGIEDSEETERDLIGRLQASLDEYNRYSGKQYLLKLSVGTARIDVSGEMTLDELIQKADASLYEQKKHKTSSPLKSS